MDFLKLEDEKAWPAKKKEYIKVPVPLTYADIPAVNGVNNLVISPANYAYGEHVAPFVQGSAQIYERLERLSKQLMSDLTGTANTYYAIGDSFAELSNHTMAAAKQAKSTVLETQSRLYLELNNMFFDLAESQMKNLASIQEYMVNFFKYASSDVENTREYHADRMRYQDEYIKERTRILEKKERLLLEGKRELTCGVTLS